MARTRKTIVANNTAALNDPWASAIEHLKRVDPRWTEWIDTYGPCLLRPKRDRFGILVRAIIGQQISAKAAASIHLRLLDVQGQGRHQPETLLELGESGIRGAGLSGVKARYLLNLAVAIQREEIPLDRIGRFRDDEIISRLTRIKGIGPWTAEMFLIFALNRPDVLSTGDLGVRVAIRDYYGLDELPAPRDCVPLAEPWRPFRTVAMWYLWKTIDSPVIPGVQPSSGTQADSH